MLMFSFCSFLAQSQTRVVCVGNSITAGVGASSSAKSWPSQLGAKLGSGFNVINCGASGTMMLKRSGSPYWNTTQFTTAKNSNPDILIIGLGTNDSGTGIWPNLKGDFYNDYVDMINQFRAGGKNPRIFVCFPAPIFRDPAQNANLINELIPIVKQVRDNMGTSFIDFYGQLGAYSGLFPDGLHPNDDGAAIFAQAVFNSILGVGGKSGTYSLQNRNSGLYMDINGASTADGATILQWTSTGGANQKFSFSEVSTGVYDIQSVSSGKYVDIFGGSLDNGANCIQWSYSAGNNQRYTLFATDNGYYKLKAVHSSRVLDVFGASTAAGTKLIQWDDNNQTNAQWKLISVTKSAKIELEPETENVNATIVFPNPAKDEIILNNIPANTMVSVFDINGKAVLKTTSSAGEKINISSLASGVYFITAGNAKLKLIKK